MSHRTRPAEHRPRPGRPKTYEREVALRKAMDAFWQRGYSATSIRDLLRATGIVPASLYAEFGGKDTLFLAAIDVYVAENSERYRELLATQPLGLDRIQRYYETFHEIADGRGCLLVNSLAERESIPSAAERRIRGFFRWLEELYRNNLRAAAKEGTMRRGVDPDALASAFVVFDQGLAIAARSTRGRRLATGALSLLTSIRA